MDRTIQKVVERIPVVGGLARRTAQAVLSRSKGKIKDSAEYWEKRYQAGRNSGSGSYEHLAEFKAEVLDEFVRERHVETVLELGCGDGAQLELAHYPSYVGTDVAPAADEMCRSKFANDATKRFHLADELPADVTADLTLSLDVIYHLIEDDVFESYMAELFDRSTRYVVVCSSNEEDAIPARHVRHRQFSRWVGDNRPEWKLIETIPNPYEWDASKPHHTSFADFFVYEAPGR